MSQAAGLLLDGALAAGVVVLSALALFARQRVASVVFFLALGLVLALVWARLGAPDVALAEAAIGAGLTGALLLDAVRRRPRSIAPAEAAEPAGPGWPRTAVALVGVALVVPAAVLLWEAVATLGRTSGLGAAVREALPGTGVEHPVTAVLLDLRSYDTLLEVAVLLVAALAVLALHPRDELADVPLPPRAEPVLSGLVNVAVPVGVVLSGWLLVLGAIAPGGAFQAGALLAGTLVLLRLTGHRSPAPGDRSLRLLLVAGTSVFLAVAFGTALFGAGLLDLDPAWAKTSILIVEIALAISIADTLAALYVGNQQGSKEALR